MSRYRIDVAPEHGLLESFEDLIDMVAVRRILIGVGGAGDIFPMSLSEACMSRNESSGGLNAFKQVPVNLSLRCSLIVLVFYVAATSFVNFM